jgi:uncharacterized protein
VQLTVRTALWLLGGGFGGGLVNAFAGGGTLLTFPLLMAAGLEPRVANATNITALWPGVVSASWGYRREMVDHPLPLLRLCALTLVGGVCGAALLVATPSQVFARLAPYLIWFAALMLLAQEWRPRGARASGAGSEPEPGAESPKLSLGLGQALVWLAMGVYGGYFGAGVSIMMLAACTQMGVRNIHQANALKNLVGVPMNLIAVVLCAQHGLVRWPEALLTACGALVGGYLGAWYGRLQHPERVRRMVVVVGVLAGVRLYLHGGV